jgi:hypothetical protein
MTMTSVLQQGCESEAGRAWDSPSRLGRLTMPTRTNDDEMEADGGRVDKLKDVGFSCLASR